MELSGQLDFFIGKSQSHADRVFSKHIYSDLASYICTHKFCSHPMFESCHQWFNHGLEWYRRQWVYNICGSTFQSVDSVRVHIIKEHQGTFLPSQLSTPIARCSRALQRIPTSECPFCNYEAMVKRKMNWMVYSEPVTIPIHAFRNHLGHHLEQLALFVLPQKAMVKRDEGLLESLASSESQSIASENVARIDNHEGFDREL